MKRILKLILSVLMATLMLFSFAACGKNKGNNGNGGDGNNPPQGGTGNVINVQGAFARGDYLARGVQDHYISYDDDGVLTAAGYYNAFTSMSEGVANCYEYSALVDMANYMLQLSTTDEDKAHWKKMLDDYVEGMTYYWGAGNQTSTHGTKYWEDLYCVHRMDVPGTGNASTDLVYDDLMWIIRDYLHAYSLTQDEKYLREAEYLTKNCLDGWDSTKNGIGGITWGPTYESKHTCSNGPIISALVQLALIYKDSDAKVTAEDTVYGAMPSEYADEHVAWENMVGMSKYDYYLQWADTVYRFCYTYLRASDGVFVDIIRPAGQYAREFDDNGELSYRYFSAAASEHKTEGRKFTYNAGSVIGGAAWLYRATGDEKYMSEARQLAEAAYRYFATTVTVDGKQMQMYDPTATPYFNSVLLRGFIDLADASSERAYTNDTAVQTEVKKYVGVFKSSLDYAFENNMLGRTLPQNLLQGWLYSTSDGSNTMDSRKDIKDAAANPAMYGMIGVYEKAHGTL